MLDEATVRSRFRKSGGDCDLHEQWRSVVSDAELIALGQTMGIGVDVSDGGRFPAGSPELAERVFAELHEQRAWWTRAHVTGEVARLIADTHQHRREVHDRVAFLFPRPETTEWSVPEVGYDRRRRAQVEHPVKRVS